MKKPAKLVNEEEIKLKALSNAEQNGIVFIDEIDKIARRQDTMGADVSREGVQRDLLPLVEGCTVSTKYGTIKTDHILFICSGAFHMSKPSDLIPELQGRLPIRVELEALTVEDFVRILTEPDASLTAQYRALLGTESVTLGFTPEGVRRIAEVAFQVNERTENIGARRLHTVMERLLDTASYRSGRRGRRNRDGGRRLCRQAAGAAGPGRGPEPLHPLGQPKGLAPKLRPTSCGPGSSRRAWQRQRAWQPRHGVRQAWRQPWPWGLSDATCRMNRRKSCRDGSCDHLFPRVSPAFLRAAQSRKRRPTVHNARHDRRARCFRSAEKRKAGHLSGRTLTRPPIAVAQRAPNRGGSCSSFLGLPALHATLLVV